MRNANREYKDRLFKFIFGNEKNKAWTLSLYNAVNNSTHEDENSIVFNTIEDVLYMGMKNDVSFLIADDMNLFEQQSSYNPNMPMRFLIYAGMIYSKYIQDNPKYYLYSSTVQKVPAPRCICFYNGTKETEDVTVLKLSDAYEKEADIEVKVTMLNINAGKNSELLTRCKPLEEYSWFTSEVNRKQKELGSLTSAIDAALDEMPQDFLIKPFLMRNRTEVKIMCLTEYDEERYKALERAEGEARGLAKGLEKGRNEGEMTMLLRLVKKGRLSESEAADEAGMTLEEFRKKMAEYQSAS